MKKSKILIIGQLPPPIGGVSIHAFRLSKFLNNYYIVKNASHKNLIKSMILSLNVKNIFIESIGHLKYLWLYYLLNKFVFKKKIVVYIHNYFRGKNSQLKWVLKSTNNVIVSNKQIMNKMKQDYICKNIHVISPFIAQHDEESKFYDADIQFEKNSFIVSFNAFKVDLRDNMDIYGFDVILNFLSKVNETKDIRLVMAIPQLEITGKNYIQNLYNKYKCPVEKITIINNKCNFVHILQKSKIFIRPSRKDGDSISIKEALLYNIPTIASDCVDRPRGVYLFKNENPEDLLRVFIEVISLNTFQKNGEINSEILQQSTNNLHKMKRLFI